jgi:DNA-binding YbaB/EbfC family protein
MENLTNMLSQVKDAQAKIKELHKKCAQLQVTAEAGAGAVKATVNGNKVLLKLEIDKEFVNPEEKEMLQDLIVAAINLANEAMEEKIKQEMGENTAGMMDAFPLEWAL